VRVVHKQRKQGFFELLDVVAVQQKDETWAAGLVLAIDDSTGHQHIRGSYIGEDGKLLDADFEEWATSFDGSVKLIDFAEVEHVVKLPPKWRNSLLKPVKRSSPSSIDYDEPEQHPSYGNIIVSNVQGTGHKLFLSPFKHQHFVSVRISHSALRRGLSEDHSYGEGVILEFSMSESQWARMVASAGQGQGTPITLDRIGGRDIDEPPARNEKTKFIDDVHKEANEMAKNVVDAVEKFHALMEKPTVSKKERSEVMQQLQHLQKHIVDSLPFIVRQFSERMDKITDEARTEIDTYLGQTALRLGMKQLAENPPLMLESMKEERPK
jgi:hypothetical protein